MAENDYEEVRDALGEVDITTPTQSLTEPATKPRKSPLRLFIIGLLVILSLLYGFHTWQYNSTHISTDNAFITSDVVPVNSTIAGSVTKIDVQDNQLVKAGDLLVELSGESRQAEVDQAEANLASAKANAGGASVDVQMAEQTGFAQVSQAEETIQLGSSDIVVARANSMKASSAVISSEAGISKAKADVQAAQAVVVARQSTLRRVREQLAASKSIVSGAQSNLKSALASLSSAQSISENATREAERSHALYLDGALSQAEADNKATMASSAKSTFDVARQQVEVAKSLLAQRQAELLVATEQIKEAEAGIVQTQAQVTALNGSLNASRAQVNEARSGLDATLQAVKAASLRRTLAESKLRETEAAKKRVGVSQGSQLSALAKVKQAAAALHSAQINLANTRIRALLDGTVSSKTVQLGQQISPGQQLLAIIPISKPWVIANFKETQLGEIHAGMSVEIEVDAIPGVHYKAHVDSISSGTGATFALLPPDNATGNFTKVVQRVPVKIVFEPNQPNLDKLRSGLSSKVAISTKG
jgi:membrane fusion protein (multidrug efflux system)